MAYPQNLERQFFECKSLLQKNALRYKKKRSSDEMVYAYRNATLRGQFSDRVYSMSVWIVPRRCYRENRHTLDFISSVVRVFCKADEPEVSKFRESVACSITHTRCTSLKVGLCSGKLCHVVEFTSWELLLRVGK
ncbi:hypothetical protein [Pampinifervens florentissimum]|uniref:hypothetical protein n=1 Tax=Pampinifervens florentissimum TaxID=1632019 RepID=UPI0013B49DB3|nr:hypothetical protein [Hydrogenobacter sp. T-8]QID33289.1 hypothetical protein G3M65_05715 [Hydrogenobacter sp. T-8]